MTVLAFIFTCLFARLNLVYHNLIALVEAYDFHRGVIEILTFPITYWNDEELLRWGSY